MGTPNINQVSLMRKTFRIKIMHFLVGEGYTKVFHREKIQLSILAFLYKETIYTKMAILKKMKNCYKDFPILSLFLIFLQMPKNKNWRYRHDEKLTFSKFWISFLFLSYLFSKGRPHMGTLGTRGCVFLHISKNKFYFLEIRWKTTKALSNTKLCTNMLNQYILE